MRPDLRLALPCEAIRALARFQVIDKRSADHELELAEYCLATGMVGYAGGKLVSYPLLRNSATEFTSLARVISKFLEKRESPASRDLIIEEFETGLVPQLEQQRAYAGWLVTCREYRNELADFVSRWSNRIDRHGVPFNGTSGRCVLFHSDSLDQSPDETSFVRDYAALCHRWRLTRLETTDLPVPVSNHSSLEPLGLTRWDRSMGGGGTHIADIYPVPSRDQISRSIRAQQAHTQTDNLAGWREVAQRKLRGGEGLKRFGHALAVHHYWSVLKARYETEIVGSTSKIDHAIGNGMGLSEESVRQLRLLIQKRLGDLASWCHPN